MDLETANQTIQGDNSSSDSGDSDSSFSLKDFAFCGGPDRSRYSQNPFVLGNECFIDGVNCLPHIITILAIIPVLIILNKSRFGASGPWVHYPGHNLRWLLTFILVVVNFAEILEGVISDIGGTHLHLFLPDVLSLLAAICTIAYYHNAEQWNSPRLLILLLLYWIGAIGVKSLKAVNLIILEVPNDSARALLTGLVLVIYLLLFIIELSLLFKLVSIKTIDFSFIYGECCYNCPFTMNFFVLMLPFRNMHALKIKEEFILRASWKISVIYTVMSTCCLKCLFIGLGSSFLKVPRLHCK